MAPYRPHRFDLTAFRCLDGELFDDCRRCSADPSQEVHTYFDRGGEAFERLAADWEITDQVAGSGGLA